MTIIAIVSVSQTSNGEYIKLLGWGASEESARRAAFTHVHGGINMYDETFKGGTVVKVSQKLRDLDTKAAAWDDTFDEAGNLVASSCPDAHHDLMLALARLVILDGELSFRERFLEQGI